MWQHMWQHMLDHALRVLKNAVPRFTVKCPEKFCVLQNVTIGIGVSK